MHTNWSRSYGRRHVEKYRREYEYEFLICEAVMLVIQRCRTTSDELSTEAFVQGKEEVGYGSNNNRERVQAMVDRVPLIAPVPVSRSAQ
jgi:hypothetical protein